MVEEILPVKVHATGLVDVFLLGVSKAAAERVLMPFIGNGTVKSGAIKLIGGSAAHYLGGMPGKYIGGGMVLDGVEDIIVSFLGGGMGFGGAGGGAGGEVW